MQLQGRWSVCDDGITRPVIAVKVTAENGFSDSGDFLVDSAADRTVFSAALLQKLQVSGNHTPSNFSLQGVGGSSPYVMVKSVLEFTREDGDPARVRGEYAAFTEPSATDMSILGRDVLNNFDVILSRRQNAVLLLAGNHQYQVVAV